MTVNHDVAGSSPAWGAKKDTELIVQYLFCFIVCIIMYLDSILMIFTKCENTGIESFFVFLKHRTTSGTQSSAFHLINNLLHTQSLLLHDLLYS